MKYVILDSDEVNDIVFSEILEDSVDTLRFNVAETETVVKYVGAKPRFLYGKTTYTHSEIPLLRGIHLYPNEATRHNHAHHAHRMLSNWLLRPTRRDCRWGRRFGWRSGGRRRRGFTRLVGRQRGCSRRNEQGFSPYRGCLESGRRISDCLGPDEGPAEYPRKGYGHDLDGPESCGIRSPWIPDNTSFHYPVELEENKENLRQT